MHIRTLVMLMMEPVCRAVLFVGTALEVPKLLGELVGGSLGGWRGWSGLRCWCCSSTAWARHVVVLKADKG